MHGGLNEVGIHSSLPYRKAPVDQSHKTTCTDAELVFEQGAPADTVYRVCQGTVIEYRSAPDTNERQITSVIGNGGFAGVTASRFYTTTGEAVVGTQVEPISRSGFVAMLLHEPGFAERLHRHLTAAASVLPLTKSSNSTDAKIGNRARPKFFDASDDNLLARVADAILQAEGRCAHVGSSVSINSSSVNASHHAPVDYQAFHRCLLILRWRRLITFSNPEFIDILDKRGLQRLALGSDVMGAG